MPPLRGSFSLLPHNGIPFKLYGSSSRRVALLYALDGIEELKCYKHDAHTTNNLSSHDTPVSLSEIRKQLACHSAPVYNEITGTALSSAIVGIAVILPIFNRQHQHAARQTAIDMLACLPQGCTIMRYHEDYGSLTGRATLDTEGSLVCEVSYRTGWRFG